MPVAAVKHGLTLAAKLAFGLAVVIVLALSLALEVVAPRDTN